MNFQLAEPSNYAIIDFGEDVVLSEKINWVEGTFCPKTAIFKMN